MIVAAFTLVLILSSVGGAVAASRDRVGERISLFNPPATYPADTAFHIWHGFLFEPSDTGYGRFEFKLEVDGAERAADFFTVEVLDRRTVSKVWTFNFPDGMTGTHTFTGHWITPDGEDTISVSVDFTS